jgi:hypothetical protein
VYSEGPIKKPISPDPATPPATGSHFNDRASGFTGVGRSAMMRRYGTGAGVKIVALSVKDSRNEARIPTT